MIDVAGTPNTNPQDGDMVRVHYIGKFVNGEIFDQSRRTADSDPFMFRLGQGQVIRGTHTMIHTYSHHSNAHTYTHLPLHVGRLGCWCCYNE